MRQESPSFMAGSSQLSLSEVGHFIMYLRRSFEEQGQILMTSHHEEAIRKFSSHNTWVLDRKSHLDPTQMRRLDELALDTDLVQALYLGEVSGLV